MCSLPFAVGNDDKHDLGAGTSERDEHRTTLCSMMRMTHIAWNVNSELLG